MMKDKQIGKFICKWHRITAGFGWNIGYIEYSSNGLYLNDKVVAAIIFSGVKITSQVQIMFITLRNVLIVI